VEAVGSAFAPRRKERKARALSCIISDRLRGASERDMTENVSQSEDGLCQEHNAGTYNNCVPYFERLQLVLFTIWGVFMRQK